MTSDPANKSKSSEGLSILKNTSALAIGRIVMMVFSFVFFVYAADLLGIEDFGKYGLVRGYFELFLSLCAAGLETIITREIAKAREDANGYLSVSIVLVNAMTVVGIVALIIIAYTLPAVSEDTRVLFLLACVALLPAVTSKIFQAGFLAFEKAEYTTYTAVMENAIRMGLSFVVLLSGLGLVWLFIIPIVSQLLMLGYCMYLWHRRIVRLAFVMDFGMLKKVFQDWRVFAVEHWLSDFFLNLDTILLSIFASEYIYGLYSAAYRIVSFGSIIATSYATAAFPLMARIAVRDISQFRRMSALSLKYMLVVVLPGVAMLSILGEDIMHLLFPKYMAAVPIFRIIVWTLFFRFVNPYLSFMLFAKNQQRKSLYTVIIALAFYSGIALLLIPAAGGLGAAMSILLAMTISFSAYFVFFNEGDTAFAKQFSFELARVVVITLGVCAAMLAIPDANMFIRIFAGLVTYAVLFVLLKVPSTEDMEMVRRIINSRRRSKMMPSGEAGVS